jgi:hypothetical protein
LERFQFMPCRAWPDANVEFDVDPPRKAGEETDALDYARLASELRRAAREVHGMAAKHACSALADQYEELARGIPPHRLSKAAPAKH